MDSPTRPQFLYLGGAARAERMRQVFAQEAPHLEFVDSADACDPARVRYLATWVAPADLATRYPGVELVFSTGAGVDQFDMASLPENTGLVRLVQTNIISGMAEYVTGAVMALHREFFLYQRQQRAGQWRERAVEPARRRRVSILGAGELGRAVIAALAPFGFNLSAWSRTERDLSPARHFSGEAGLTQMLEQTDILVCLLPLTSETTGILCRKTFEAMPRGGALINVGRGRHLVEQDLLWALDSGQLGDAVLDVTTPEPLPEGHPFYSHPNILLTPHIASVTDGEEAARAMIANISRHHQGLAPHGLVARDRGY